MKHASYRDQGDQVDPSCVPRPYCRPRGMLLDMASEDPAERRRIAALGGRARAQQSTESLSAAGRAGADALHSAPVLARRLVKRWPALNRKERAEVREILRPIMPRER